MTGHAPASIKHAELGGRSGQQELELSTLRVTAKNILTSWFTCLMLSGCQFRVVEGDAQAGRCPLRKRPLFLFIIHEICCELGSGVSIAWLRPNHDTVTRCHLGGGASRIKVLWLVHVSRWLRFGTTEPAYAAQCPVSRTAMDCIACDAICIATEHGQCYRCAGSLTNDRYNTKTGGKVLP